MAAPSPFRAPSFDSRLACSCTCRTCGRRSQQQALAHVSHIRVVFSASTDHSKRNTSCEECMGVSQSSAYENKTTSRATLPPGKGQKANHIAGWSAEGPADSGCGAAFHRRDATLSLMDIGRITMLLNVDSQVA
eukprot:4013846-Pleurochrysis_carterae.AAC.2